MSEIKPEKTAKNNKCKLRYDSWQFIKINALFGLISLYLFSAVFSSFISLKSVGAKQMTILHSFPALLTISQRKRHYHVGQSSNMHC